MTRKDRAVELFKSRFNCCQAVFSAYRDEAGLDERTALKLATVFGAGVAGTGQHLCGAVTGALMALSMKHGRGELESLEAKAATYELARRFMARFEALNGSCLCAGLIGFDIGTPEGMKRAEEQRVFQTKCVEAVRSSAEILEEML